VSRVGFRSRLFAILTLFAILPALVLTLVWGGAISRVLPAISGSGAWERIASSGERVVAAFNPTQLSPAQRAALRTHEQELQESLTQAQRFRFLAVRAVPVVFGSALLALGILAFVASRVAGHLSRQLSRPIHELVGWTARIEHGLPLPEGAPRKGAPEFEVLRSRMRAMAIALSEARVRAMEAERLQAFRESARQVAHELKNPLTPIRFAVARLRREAPESLADAVDVLDVESRRLEEMARNFAQFGRLPEGPQADIDMGELARYAAKAAVPPQIELAVHVDDGLPMVRGHHDALARALSNVLLNAVDACRDGGRIDVNVGRQKTNGTEQVTIAVRDTGQGIPADKLPRIWDPYVTHKAGGTGLGLAIARQTILAHHGSVGATSTAGAGTEISFTLPANGAHGAEGTQ
jgi:two-component system nitrogen regulation sensor histidine kinase NtrY